MPNKLPADGLSSAKTPEQQAFDERWAARIEEGRDVIRLDEGRDRHLLRDVDLARQSYKADARMELLERAMAEIERLEALAAKYRAGMMVGHEAFFAEAKLRSEEKQSADRRACQEWWNCMSPAQRQLALREAATADNPNPQLADAWEYWKKWERKQ